MLKWYIVKTHMEIKKEAERFFSEFLNHSPSSYQVTTVEELGDLFELW